MASKPQLASDNTQPSFTAAQLRDMLKQAEEAEAKLAEEKGAEIRAELEALVSKKYGLTLEAIGLVEKQEREPRYFKGTDGKIYTYLRGKVPAAIKNKDDKLDLTKQCNADGTALNA